MGGYISPIFTPISPLYQDTFYVGGYAQGGQPQLLSARPRVRRGEVAPSHRFASRAEPSAYTAPCRVEAEEDLLHVWELPAFAEEGGGGKALGQHDSELLLSYLTAPYLRVPLVATFFASEDRIHLLQMPKLQAGSGSGSGLGTPPAPGAQAAGPARCHLPLTPSPSPHPFPFP